MVMIKLMPIISSFSSFFPGDEMRKDGRRIGSIAGITALERESKGERQKETRKRNGIIIIKRKEHLVLLPQRSRRLERNKGDARKDREIERYKYMRTSR